MNFIISTLIAITSLNFNFLLSNQINYEDYLPSLTLEEKVGQLFMIGVFLGANDEEIQPYLTDYKAGNLYIQGKYWTSAEQIRRIKNFQKEVKIPYLIAQDLEWGLSQRMSDAIVYPHNMTLGAIQDLSLIEEMGEEVARQCKAIGVNLNFAPCVDVNTNPDNPVINARSFGDTPEKVSERGIAMMQGFKKHNLKSTAKHFPGHGDTSLDSHFHLPTTELAEAHLQPFRKLIEKGVDCVMVGHLYIPTTDQDNPASLSKTIIDVLKNELHFKGLIVTDDLMMKALSDDFETRALKAFKAGHHILLFTDNQSQTREAFKRGYKALIEGFRSGELSIAELDKRVAKILAFKSTINVTPTEEPINLEKSYDLQNRLYRSAITKINDFPLLAPIQVMKECNDDVWGNTIIFAGSPYKLKRLPDDRAIVLCYEKEGVDEAYNAIEENKFYGILPIKK